MTILISKSLMLRMNYLEDVPDDVTNKRLNILREDMAKHLDLAFIKDLATKPLPGTNTLPSEYIVRVYVEAT